MIARMTLFYLIFIVITFPACNTFAPLNPEDPSLTEPPFAFDLKMGHKFLTGAEYESYSLTKTIFSYQCGHITKYKSFKEFKFTPIGQGKKELTKANIRDLKTTLVKFINYFNKNKPPLPQPGNIEHLSDPGFVSLDIKFELDHFQIATSVDAVSDANSKLLTELRLLVSTIRGNAPKMCNAKTFYGIPAS